MTGTKARSRLNVTPRTIARTRMSSDGSVSRSLADRNRLNPEPQHSASSGPAIP